MILASLGKLSVAQDLSGSSSTDSTNVIEIAKVDFGAMTDLWWVVQTETIAAGDGSDTFDFILYLSQENTLDTNKEVMSVGFTGIADKRAATVGRFIAAFNIGKQMMQMLEDDGSDFEFIGMISTLSAGATISIDAWLSFTEPHTLQHRMQVESNIDNSINVASAGSGA